MNNQLIFKMILGIGIDIVSVSRIERLLKEFGNKFERKVFTDFEILQIKKNKAVFYAKRFAAKEAFSKALGLGIGRGIDFLDIEIYNDKQGKPLLRILNGKEQFVKEHFKVNDFATHLSLTDESELAQAQVILEKL